MSAKDAASWDRYWAHGFLTSCADAFRGNYEGAMHTVWQTRFGQLHNGARILDVCTGNGAIALIAAATNDTLIIDAVDRAAIQPARAVSDAQRELLEKIRFHPQTDAAAMPFPDACFDLVCGHFALEYTNTAQTVAELARVTAPGGSAFFVLHHNQSAILKTTREEQGHLALLDQCELLPRARAFIELVGGAAPAVRQHLQSSPEAERRRHALNEAAAAVTDEAKQSQHPEILRIALGIVSDAYQAIQKQGTDAALARLDAGAIEIEANALRLEDLRGAALSRQDMQRLCDAFGEHGFGSPVTGTLSDDNGLLIGWTLETRRGA